MNKINNKKEFILNYIASSNKFILSSELIDELIKKFPNTSKENARKIISNLKKNNEIISSEPITFSNNSYAYALKNKKVNYKNLEHLIKNHKKKLFRAICLIKREKGVITYNELAKITAGVTAKFGNNLEIEQIIKELSYFNIGIQREYKGITFIVNNKSSNYDLDQKILQLEKENKTIIYMLNWLKDINIINIDDQFTFKGKGNNFKGIENGNLIWDAFFFTNTSGISNLSDSDKKTIGVVDFSYKTEYDWLDVEGLKDRVNIFINSTKNQKRKVFPIIFADKITNAAKKLIKENNYMCVDIKKILGNNYERIISQYIEIENKEKIDIDEVDKICNLIGSNANYGNMKGNLFEYMMGEVFRKIYNEIGNNINHSIIIDGKEIDYRIETINENIYIELKAYKKETEIKLGDREQKSTVNWAYQVVFEAFKRNFKNDKSRKCKFCYITTAKFEDKALEKLEDLNAGKFRAEKLECYYDRERLLNLLKKYDCKKEIKIIKNYF